MDSPLRLLAPLAVAVLAVLFAQDLHRRLADQDTALARIQQSTNKLHGVVW